MNGSYHTDTKGSEISGVTFPVKLGEGVDLSAYKQVTGDDVVSITVTNRGQTITMEYKGKDALFENADHAYYMLTEVPDYYKEVTVGEDGSLKFGAVTGSVQTVSGAGATLNPVSSYGDYQISITAESLNTDKVYGVKPETSDGASYGLRHLENIWQGKNLAFCTRFTTSVHGSPTSSSHYTSIMGKTINKIIYYTKDEIHAIDVNLYVPIKSYQTVAATVDGAAKQLRTIQIAAQDGTVSYDHSKLDLSDISIFPNGAGDAYLVTVNGETQLVGDKTLSRWVGTWESWEKYLDPSGAVGTKYPYLNQVWELAYHAYIASFQAAGIDMTATMPDAASLQAYWKNIASTKGVETVEITSGGHGSYAVKWLDASGNELSSGNYQMTGKLLKGFEGAPAYVFTTKNDGGYKYLIAMLPGMEGTEKEPIAAHYHFQFGNSLDDMLLKGELYNSTDYGTNPSSGRPLNSNLKNSQWYATVIDAESTDLAWYNVILGLHQADKWSSLPSSNGDSGTGNGGGGGGSSKPSIKSDTTPAPAVTPNGSAAGFSDVPASAWYADSVRYVVDRGLFGGVGNGNFAPDANMTRSMMWTVLARYMGVDTSGGSNWYETARNWAVAQGISDGTMADGNVTREQFVTMLWRLSGEPVVENRASFTDSENVSGYASKAVDWAVSQGILNGYNDGTFRPQGSATRAEVAKMLTVFCTNAEAN